ncbi:hypothetical protein [Acinetobacter bereziniae]|uniref:hypothetical protein n=1 Tax=Acinetobacter bereziniae TaxID=106648 RepID=UPI00224D7574|nr:hypothetical protein [Acinetobacter bereziniae]
MKLPSVKNVGIYYKWSNHKIETKTLELRPFEKSDMSPYLIHMTSEAAILSILESGGCNQGKINAGTPTQKVAFWYDSKIVCFTETPIFAIDFFRYKSHKRWLADLRYGIGFSKKSLADKGVRPALYVDKTVISLIASLRDAAQESKERLVYEKLIPLITPLDYDSDEQGFMWEREWRYTDPEGFIFNYSDIEIICCPRNEVESLVNILGEHSNNIKFIETWGEYEEVSEYLESRRNSNEMRLIVNSSGIDELRSAHLELSQELSKLEAYKTQIDRLHTHSSMIEAELPLINDKIETIQRRIAQQEWLETHCCECHHPFKDAIKPPLSMDMGVDRFEESEPDENMQTWICLDCHISFLFGA